MKRDRYCMGTRIWKMNNTAPTGGTMLKHRMTCILLSIITVMLFMPQTLFAETVYFFGKIGEFPVAGYLRQDKGELSGWYFYISRARQIQLDGNIDRNGNFRMEETANYKKSGVFEGNVKQGKWTGTWRKTSGDSPLQFYFEENHDQLEDIKSNFRCAFKEPVPEGNYHVEYELKLGIANGILKKINASQAARGKYVDNLCFIELKDMVQVESKTGILLEVAEQNESTNGMKCTVRILGNKDILWLRFGDSSEAGDDCRGSSDRMFCSTRGGWTHMILDRRTQKCKALP